MKIIDNLSRRNFLKTAAAATTAATLVGCSNGDESGSNVINPKDDLVFDKNVKVYHSTGAYNCGSRCVHKVHVKNGKVVKITSAGDKARGDEADKIAEYDSSELGKPIELRACVRCYGGYQGLLYQPDRLKYPLMRIDPNKERGDVNNFKRVSWDVATDAIVDKLAAAIKRTDLTYTPVMSRYFMWLTMAANFGAIKPFISMNGNESFGGVDLGTYDTIGLCAYVNSRSDRYNTKFMITWALDATRTTYWNVHTHFMNTKMKEGKHGDIPMVVISSNYSDAASMLSTGLTYTYSINGSSKTVIIPRWIACRPATDAALATGMAYVIYKNRIKDKASELAQTHTYLGDGSGSTSRNVFGFWANDQVTSKAPTDPSATNGVGGQKGTYQIKLPVALAGTEPYVANMNGKTGAINTPFTGIDFKVPVGESYEEYLLSREVEWGGYTGATTSGKYKTPDPVSNQATPGDAVYANVLNHIAKITGVASDVIEALGMKYSEYMRDPNAAAFIETGGGPQRAWNASEWVWSLIGLSTMCGYNEKKGGGVAGMSMSHFPEYLGFNVNGVRTPPFGSGGAALPNAAGILIELSNWQHLVLTGKDHRTKQQMADDIYMQTGGAVDLSSKVGTSERMLEIDVIIHTNLNNLHTHPNVAKNALAYKKAKYVVVMDQVMTPTALMADVILPATPTLEYESYAIPSNTTGSTFFHREQAVPRSYDTLTERELQQLLTDKLNAKLGVDIPMFSFAPFDTFPKERTSILESDYDSVVTTDYYKTKVQDIEIPTAEALQKREDGLFMLETSKDKVLLPMKDLLHPGELDTSTGYINFYSPWRAMRNAEHVDLSSDPLLKSFLYRPGGWRNATMCYQPCMQGREWFFDDPKTLANYTGLKSPFNGQQGWNRTYHFMYLTNKSRNRGHTVFDSVAAIKDEFPQVAKMNAGDAANKGIKNGDMVYVYNDRGCINIPVEVSQSIPPGIVSIEHGAWYRAGKETVKVWMQNGSDAAKPDDFHLTDVPVDVGGADNTLTNDFFGEDSVFCGGACPAQSGPCEISLTKPE